MKKDYLQFMNDSEECINAFFDACNDMQNSRYILADKKIADILKSIAASKRLYSLFYNTLINFDYENELETSTSASSFKIPSSPSKAAALVFMLLLDIDSGKINLKDFLAKYFYNPSINAQYENFCNSIISGLNKNIKSLISA